MTATLKLGHARSIGVGVSPNASGLGVSADGKTLVVANNYNDSISMVDTISNTVRYEHDLRPFGTRDRARRHRSPTTESVEDPASLCYWSFRTNARTWCWPADRPLSALTAGS